MDVFEFRNKLVGDYQNFTRSFIQPKADDIRAFLDAEYDAGRYWPSPLIQINPSYVTMGTVDSLASEGILHPKTAAIFRFGKSATSTGVPATLYKHQREAIDCCQRHEPYVLRYILDPADVMGPDYPSVTFPGLKRKEVALYGEYLTQRRVLETFDLLVEEGHPA